MKHLFLVGVLLLVAAPSSAQGLLGKAGEPGTVAGERARYGATVTADEVCTILARVVRGRSDYGLLLKGGGAGCVLPDGRRVSGDTIIYAPQAPAATNSEHFDVLYDWDGARIAKPKWDSNGPCVPGPSSGCEMSRFTRVEASMKLPGDSGNPPPPPVGGDVQALMQQMDAMFAEILALKARTADLDAQLAGLANRSEAQSQESDATKADIKRIDAFLAKRPIPKACRVSFVGCRFDFWEEQ
jgi:hypothetical protein